MCGVLVLVVIAAFACVAGVCVLPAMLLVLALPVCVRVCVLSLLVVFAAIACVVGVVCFVCSV